MPVFNDRRFRWLMRLLPREFREDHESELLQVWRDEVGDAGARRTRAVWYAALVDTLRVASKEHVMAFSSHLRIAIRQLRRAPAFAAAAILTLGVGLGATAGVFSVVNAVLLRPMPWHAPEEVALIWAVTPTGSQTWLSYPEIEDLQTDATQWAGIAAFTDVRPQLTRAGVAEELQGVAVSHGLFRVLGVTPAFGRDFAREDDRPEAAGVVIVSDAFWRTRLGADAAVIGRSMRLDGREHVVVGVLPSGFDLLPASSVLPGRIDVWLPLEPRLASRDRTVRTLHALGRVAAHATFATASDQIAAYGRRVSAAHPAAYTDGTWTFRAVPFADDVLRPSRTPLLLLLALVSVALLMACANVTNLLLARGESRRGEMAIRTALGASPARLAGELLTEGFVLAVAGGVLGLGLATTVPRAIRAVAPDAFPRLSQASIDARVAGVMVVLGLVTIAVFSAVPMLERSRVRAPSMSLTGRGR